MRGREREARDDRREPCPAAGCQASRKVSAILCGWHWRRLPGTQRAAVEEAQRLFRLEHTREAAVACREVERQAVADAGMFGALAAGLRTQDSGLRKTAVRR
jgi:hypothetical protein